MPAKSSGSEGTDVARKFTDIRILEGLYMNAFQGVLWIAHTQKQQLLLLFNAFQFLTEY